MALIQVSLRPRPPLGDQPVEVGDELVERPASRTDRLRQTRPATGTERDELLHRLAVAALSAAGMPSISQITIAGSGRQNDSTKSARAFPQRPFSSASTMRSMRGARLEHARREGEVHQGAQACVLGRVDVL